MLQLLLPLVWPMAVHGRSWAWWALWLLLLLLLLLLLRVCGPWLLVMRVVVVVVVRSSLQEGWCRWLAERERLRGTVECRQPRLLLLLLLAWCLRLCLRHGPMLLLLLLLPLYKGMLLCLLVQGRHSAPVRTWWCRQMRPWSNLLVNNPCG